MVRVDELNHLYLDNLRLHRPDVTAALCPICLRPMRMTADDADDAVTEGHVFPRSSGVDGGTVVECFRCNRSLGSACDQEFVRQLRFDQFRAGMLFPDGKRALFHASADPRVNSVPATVTVRDDGGMHIKVHGPQTVGPGDRIDFTFRAPSFDVALVGALHSAYLRMVYLFGYEYALNPNVAGLRSDLAMLGALAPLPPRSRPVHSRQAAQHMGSNSVYQAQYDIPLDSADCSHARVGRTPCFRCRRSRAA